MFKKLLIIALVIGFLIVNWEGVVWAAEKNTDSKPIIIDRTDYPVLYISRPNLQGEAVWIAQARLQELGFEVEKNGQYNLSTARAVRLFQTANGLKEDGIINKEVWEMLQQGQGEEACLAGEQNNNETHKVAIVIDVNERSLVLYEDYKEKARFSVAVGKSSTPTPLGEWKVVHKSLNWGNGFGTRWMGLNVPWGIYGIHGTNKPGSIGSYASHGCIRMFNRDVEKLYPMVPMGTTVKIVRNGKIEDGNFKPVAMKKGSSSQKVVFVQSRLNDLGIIFDRADGRYGSMTELAVKYFQAWHLLPVTGEMNDETYKAMGMIPSS
ncbi:MAG: peptidoglycan-binding protein [Syntrophomonadaceae bacterium]|nr:peptidoglycan-binding protein [Syntrophomonadaceae bacterium]